MKNKIKFIMLVKHYIMLCWRSILEVLCSYSILPHLAECPKWNQKLTYKREEDRDLTPKKRQPNCKYKYWSDAFARILASRRSLDSSWLLLWVHSSSFSTTVSLIMLHSSFLTFMSPKIDSTRLRLEHKRATEYEWI